jgi:histone acetyltransferase 1
LRDLNDLARLRRDSPEFANLRINSKTSLRPKGPVPKDIVDPNVLEKIRKEFKIAPRQFSRLVEMHTLSFIPTAVRQSLLPQAPSKVPDLKAREHEYHLWQLLTKQRLYRHNKDSLMQLERAERIEKLGDALGNVETDYARLLRTFDERNSQKEKTVANGTNGQSSLTSSKRVSPMDAEDDDEPSSKKIKFA